jgi:hypothetical protein
MIIPILVQGKLQSIAAQKCDAPKLMIKHQMTQQGGVEK